MARLALVGLHTNAEGRVFFFRFGCLRDHGLRHICLERKRADLLDLIKSGRLPISRANVELIPADPKVNPKQIISQKSVDADLTIIGFRSELIKAEGIKILTGYEDIGNILFVSTMKEKEIR